MTGLLLLDVDGPLNPYAAKSTRRPDGYVTYRRTPSGGWHTGRNARRFKGLRVWLNPEHGAQLLALAEETGLELAWATTWQHEANDRIGPVLGLPALPVVEFPDYDRGWNGAASPSRGGAAAGVVRRRARRTRWRGRVRPAEGRHAHAAVPRRPQAGAGVGAPGGGAGVGEVRQAGARETATHLIWAQETPRSTRGHPTQARWSSGMDTGFSRRRHGFDPRTRHHGRLRT